MRDLNIINHIFSAELNLSRETIDIINKLSEVFNLDNIFTINDSKQDVSDKLNKLYPKKVIKTSWHMDTNMLYFNQKQENNSKKGENIWIT